jgi:hypothetical protein
MTGERRDREVPLDDRVLSSSPPVGELVREGASLALNLSTLIGPDVTVGN